MDTQRPLAILLLIPAQEVVGLPFWWCLGLEFLTHSLFHLFSEPFHSHISHQILQSGMLPVASSTVVPLDCDDSLSKLQGVILRHPAQQVRMPREGMRRIMGSSGSTTCVDEVTINFSSSIQRSCEAHIISVEVDGVVPGNCDSNFEFPGKVVVQVNGLRLLLLGLGLIIQPNFVVGIGTRLEMVRNQLSKILNFCVLGLAQHIKCACNVSNNITTRCLCG
mmetsp:Transcript_36182/g.64744  ORF Transcript_36182/g.64744 Transcript_36182/m.64744 type:complete len:221 (-) Transcript_36182:589-1251(-)